MKQKLILSVIFGSLLLIIGKSFALQEKKQAPARIKIIQADELRFERRLEEISGVWWEMLFLNMKR